jgi:putative lipoprotein
VRHCGQGNSAVIGLLASITGLAPVPTSAGEVSGTIVIGDRTSPPRGAVVSVSLRDVSRQDTVAEEISTIELRPNHPPPYPFMLRYNPARLHPAHTYAVSARILIDGRLAYISTRRYPVITRGAARSAEIVVEPVGRP